MPDRRVKIHLLCTRLGRLLVIHILQVDAPDARDLLLEECNRVAAAIYIVPCVQTETQFIGRKQRKKMVNFLGSFHVAPNVVVKGYP